MKDNKNNEIQTDSLEQVAGGGGSPVELKKEVDSLWDEVESMRVEFEGKCAAVDAGTCSVYEANKCADRYKDALLRFNQKAAEFSRSMNGGKWLVNLNGK